ncbi:MAG: hypothetical protein FJ207_05095 [Gemmatimonadetes bacterium]|nr:hypothetical protein [Gemmatimonadota bacterium]
MRRMGTLMGLLASLGAADDLCAQASVPETINLFFDCAAPGCDLDFARREAPWVNWMRDRADADLHVLVTSQAAGGGGRFFTLAFLGLRALLGQDQELTFSTPADATVDDQRQGIVERLKLGLVRYVQGTPAADRLRVTYDADPPAAPGAPEARPGANQAAGAQQDPWDFWTFSINGSANANGEATSRFANWRTALSANRTTEAWKIDFGLSFSRNTQEFEVGSGATARTIEVKQEDRRANGLFVRSVGAQWAVGMRGSASSSTRLNQRLRLAVEPGVEFNFFPYTESSRRSLTLQYLVGPNYYHYDERTIFNQTVEALFQQSLTAGLSLIQPWGLWSTSVTAAQYLHDLERSSVTVFGNVNMRLFRGFSVFANANYQWVRDQLYISAASLTTEQILLRQRQLETSYRYFYSVGIQYRFGSIFNNVVNPRFGGGGGDFIIFN